LRDIDPISGDVGDVTMRLYRHLGLSLFESVYETILAARLTRVGYPVARD